MKLHSSKLDRFTIQYPNSSEYRTLKQEIFTQNCYYFECEDVALQNGIGPRIIDAGAHIGMTTLYFKKIFPFAEIIAIEPNPQMAEIFEHNMWQNDCQNVELIQAALGDGTAATTQLFVDASGDHWDSTASFQTGAWSRDQADQSQALTAPAVVLSDFLQEPVDFLKMDIEGAELAALTAARDFLPQIVHCIIEFHPTESQTLKQLLELLERAGFTTTVWRKNRQINPDLARGLTLVEGVRRK